MISAPLRKMSTSVPSVFSSRVTKAITAGEFTFSLAVMCTRTRRETLSESVSELWAAAASKERCLGFEGGVHSFHGQLCAKSSESELVPAP